MSEEEDPYDVGVHGKCPHCRDTVIFAYPRLFSVADHSELKTGSGGDMVHIYTSKCPNRDCSKPIVTAKVSMGEDEYIRLVHPFNIVRTVPSEVPPDIREDYLEAAAVLPISEKASAALSRRCLQNLLNERNFRGKNLSKQIDAVLPKLPTDLAKNVDTIRVVGIWGAHPLKSKSTGTIVDVEPGEADWNLDVLEGLFDHFYVRPAREEEKRKRLEKKLKEIGKPPLKKP